jgi:hypothetical protein
VPGVTVPGVTVPGPVEVVGVTVGETFGVVELGELGVVELGAPAFGDSMPWEQADAATAAPSSQDAVNVNVRVRSLVDTR